MSRRRNPTKPKRRGVPQPQWIEVHLLCTDRETHDPAWLYAYMAPPGKDGRPIFRPDGRCWGSGASSRRLRLTEHHTDDYGITWPDAPGVVDHEDGSRSLPPCPECGKRTTITDPQRIRELLNFATPGRPRRVDITTGTLLDS